MDIVDQLLTYRENSDIKLLITSNTDIEQQNLNVIVIEILSWLKSYQKKNNSTHFCNCPCTGFSACRGTDV